MTLQKHDLQHEFPEYHDLIEELKTSDSRFSRLFDRYHEVDREIRKIETGEETCPDEYLEERKKERLHLKDEVFSLLKENT